MQPESESPKPLLIYDGDCSLCLRCVDYGRSLTGDAVAYRAYQQVAGKLPQIPIERFRAAAQFVDRDGSISSGAEAIFRALSYAPGWKWLLWLYVHVPLFAGISERVYAWVARHRNGLSRLLGLH
ncbi:MAG: DUF393 domain-containing protein [Acidobacteria bacterium]|nr:DUF393 domain-containing protein [Acidobacteriota bacterium]